MPAWNEAQASDIIRRHAGREGALLPILHACRRRSATCRRGRAVDRRGAQPYARRGARRRHLLSRLPRRAGRPARAEALPRRSLPVDGGERAGRAASLDRFGVEWGGTTPDGRVTLEAVYCLGLCASAPSAMLDGELIGTADAASSIDDIAREVAAMTTRIFVPRDAAARAVGADKVAAAHRRRGRNAAASTSRSCAPARAACSGWSRWSRSRRRRAASPIGPVTATTSPGLFDAGLLDGGAHPLCARPAGGDSLPQAARRG